MEKFNFWHELQDPYWDAPMDTWLYESEIDNYLDFECGGKPPNPHCLTDDVPTALNCLPNPSEQDRLRLQALGRNANATLGDRTATNPQQPNPNPNPNLTITLVPKIKREFIVTPNKDVTGPYSFN